MIEILDANCPPAIKSEERFFIGRDNDYRCYIIPVLRQEEWLFWRRDGDEDIVPDFATRIDGSPSYVTFTDPRTT